MDNGKALVLGAVMKYDDKPFRARNICDLTGLSRQNVAYHLNRLVETGLVEKQGVVYFTRDKNGLIDAMVDSSDKSPAVKAFNTTVLTKVSPEALNNVITLVTMARSMELDTSFEFKQALLNDLSESIKSLKQARKYLTDAGYTKLSTQRRVKKMNKPFENAYWEWLLTFVPDPEVNKDEITAQVNEFREEDFK